MKELYRKGVANHPGPESCVCTCKGVDEALTGEYAGRKPKVGEGSDMYSLWEWQEA